MALDFYYKSTLNYLETSERTLENSGLASSPTPKIISSQKKIIYSEDHIKLKLIKDAGKNIYPLCQQKKIVFFVSKNTLKF